MADLIDRISGASEPARPKIPVHYFMALERLYAFGEWTRQDIAAALDLQGDEATQAGQLADQIDAQTGASNKALYILRVESVSMCIETQGDTLYHSGGAVNKAKVYEDLLITG